MAKGNDIHTLSEVIDLYFENYKILANSFFVFGFFSYLSIFENSVINETFNKELNKTDIDIDLDLLLKKIDSKIINNSNDQSKALLGVLGSKKNEVIDSFGLVMDSAFYENAKRIETGLDNEKAKYFFNNSFTAFGFYGENRLLTIENLLRVIILRFEAEYSQIMKRFEYLSNTSKKEFQEQEQYPPSFKNNFDNVNETIVFDYFKKNLVDTKYISLNDLNLFLEFAFEKMEIPKHKISFKNLKTKQEIVRMFYDYYKIIAGKPYGKQQKYLNLLRNYFNGFENFEIKNFSI